MNQCDNCQKLEKEIKNKDSELFKHKNATLEIIKYSWRIKAKLEALKRQAEKMEKAIKFCKDIAEEEHGFQSQGVGAECALKHIIRKSLEVLSSWQKFKEARGK